MMSSSSYKIGLGLLLLSKTYRTLTIERNLESNFGNNQLSIEYLTVGAHFWVSGNLGHYEAYLYLSVALVLISDAVNTETGFGQIAFFFFFL